MMHRIPNWLIWVILVGVILDFALGGVSSYLVINQQATTRKLQHTNQAAQCWDRVLDKAVVGKTPKAELQSEAVMCVRYVP